MDERISKINIKEALKYDPLINPNSVSKIEIPIDLLKSREKRKAWVVRYANGYAVQCFEDEKDADYFIETSKKKDAGWFDFINKVYREVKPGWVIHRKGVKITFETMSEGERKAFDEKLLNEDKRVNKIEIQISQIEKFAKTGLVRKKVPVTRKGKKTMEYRWVRAEERVKVPETGMNKENIVSVKSGNASGIVGSMHEKEIYICKFKDNSNGIYKVLDSYNIIGETLYYKINKILNWNICPETVEADFGEGVGSCQRWVPDSVSVLETVVEKEDFEDLSKIFVQDILCGNRDRHDENVIKKGNKWYAIDNESWGSIRPRDDWMDSLNNLISTGNIGMFSPMIKWMSENYIGDVKDFEIFKKSIINNMKYIVENKDKIKQLYSEHEKSPDRSINLGTETIIENIEYLEKYLQENK